MKNVLKTVFTFVFIAFLIAGIIGLLIPFEFENFRYDKVSATKPEFSSSINISFEIENKSSTDYSNVTIEVTYSTLKGMTNTKYTKNLYYNLQKGTNTITFTHSDGSNVTRFGNLNNVVLHLDNGNTFEIFYLPLFSANINWLFIGFIIIGFFGTTICLTSKLFNKKQQEIAEKDQESFNDKIRKAFTPVADTFNTIRRTFQESQQRINDEQSQKPHKVTCPYCKGKYNSNEDKCPHCGAPPETSN